MKTNHTQYRLPIVAPNDQSQTLTLKNGETVSVQKIGGEIRLTYQGKSLTAPFVSPLTEKPCCEIDGSIPNAILLYYESSPAWPQHRIITCGAGVILITKSGLEKLPNVLPGTYVNCEEELNQLVIARVEASPFGTPCAALLDTEALGTDVAQSYVFPTDEPIIVESFAATTSQNVHESACYPGTGPCYGDVPFVFAWTSPSNHRYGWALALTREWEICGVEKPADPKEAFEKRYVGFDSIDPNEEYDLSLGGEGFVHFKALYPIQKAESGKFYSIYREDLLQLALEHRESKQR